MKLYLISQSVNSGYDTYDSAVVIADSEEEARMVHPEKDPRWNGVKNHLFDSWADAKDVQVVYLGEAEEGLEDYGPVICSSFNAG